MEGMETKRIVIVGATSGIGYEVAMELLRQGWHVGVAGRRVERLREIEALAPARVKCRQMDVTREDAPEQLHGLVEELGGMDVFLLCAGIGRQNPTLQADVELTTAQTNVEAYSATKRFQNTYIDALAQLARMQRLAICFTDIRPGFVDTDLLRGDKRYPMLMNPARVAARIVRALGRRERVCVIDGRYRLLVFLWRLIPRWLWERMPVKN